MAVSASTSTSGASIAGLASGIQWADMIDQIMTAQTKQQLDPVTAQSTAVKARQDAWKSYTTLITGVRDAAKTLADGTTFDKYVANAGVSPVSGRATLSIQAGSGSVPGSYKMEVLSTATAEKLGSNNVADASASLGLTGSFLVAGKQVSVTNGDSLAVVRDKINAMNTGTSPSHVSATILTVASGVNRLVLTNETTGAAGIELTENGGSSVLSSLGLVGSALVANSTSSGAVRSYGFSSPSATVAQGLGVSMPAASTFKVNGNSVSVDLSTDSLAAVVAKINTATGATTASVVTETVNGASQSRIVVSGAVTVDVGDAANSTTNLQQLGFLKNQRAGEVQTLRMSTAQTDITTGLAATSASKLVDMGAAIGNTLTFSGTRTDGTVANVSVVVGAGTTLQDVMNAVTATGTGFGVTGHAVTASIDGSGRLQLADTTVGDSKLSFAVANDNVGGGTLDFGSASVVTQGRAMQLAKPTDAQMRIDGVLLSRSTNTISDALSGVTLSLLNAEVGSLVDVNVSRDNDTIVNSVKGLAAAFNAAATFVNSATGSTGPMPTDGSIRSTISALKHALQGSITGLTNLTYKTASLIGVTLDKTGKMQVDDAALRAAIAASPNEVKTLFQSVGTSSLAAVQYMGATAGTKAGTYAVAITSAATKATSSSTALVGAYGNAAIANQMLVTDSFTGHTSTITLGNSDTLASIVSKLNTAFGADKLQLTASVGAGNVIQIDGANYGSGSSITTAFKLDGVDAAQQLGFAPGAVGGTDVAGTINGQAATGAGQLLTASVPAFGVTNDAQGLAVLFTGTSAASANVTYVRGLGGAFTDAANPMITPGSGMIDLTADSMQRTLDSLTTRQTNIQNRLDRARALLTAQFTAMESALAKIQAQGARLTGQINALNSLNSNNQ